MKDKNYHKELIINSSKPNVRLKKYSIVDTPNDSYRSKWLFEMYDKNDQNLYPNNNCFFIIKNKITSDKNLLYNITNKYITNNRMDLTSNKLECEIKNIIIDVCYAKIIGYESSANLFKYKNAKKLMFESNKLYHITDLYFDYVCKDDGVKRPIYILYNKHLNRALKFDAEDVQLVLPNFEAIQNGYKFKKKNVFSVGTKVVIKNNKHTKLLKNNVYEVKNVLTTNNKKYALLEHNGLPVIVNNKKFKVV